MIMTVRVGSSKQLRSLFRAILILLATAGGCTCRFVCFLTQTGNRKLVIPSDCTEGERHEVVTGKTDECFIICSLFCFRKDIRKYLENNQHRDGLRTLFLTGNELDISDFPRRVTYSHHFLSRRSAIHPQIHVCHKAQYNISNYIHWATNKSQHARDNFASINSFEFPSIGSLTNSFLSDSGLITMLVVLSYKFSRYKVRPSHTVTLNNQE